MAQKSEEVIETKDRWAILVLIARDHVPNRIEPVTTNSGSQITLYEFPSTAHTDFEAWMRGETAEPFGSFRKLKNAEDLFKDNKHRFTA